MTARFRGVAVTAGLATNAVATIVPQVFALGLVVSQYATFSLVFIVLGLSLSSLNSLIIDQWLRLGESAEVPYRPMGVAATMLGLVGTLIPSGLGYVHASGAALVCAGVLAISLRTCVRLVLVGQSRWVAAIVSDLVLLTSFLIGVAILWDPAAWTSVWLPLTIGSALALIPAVPLFFVTGPSTRAWFGDHRRSLVALWMESAVLDAGVALPPLLLAKVMSPAGFAVVRAASSALLPIRLVVTPMRSWIANWSPQRVLHPRGLVAMVLAAGSFTVALAVAITVAGNLEITQHTVLPRLAEFSWQVGSMGGLQLVGVCLYLMARRRLSTRRLLAGRVVDTGSQTASLLLGYALGGLAGIMTGFVVLSAVSVLVWGFLIARPVARQTDCPATP